MKTLKFLTVISVVAASLLGVFSWQQYHKVLVLQKENQKMRTHVADTIADRNGISIEDHLSEVIEAVATGQAIDCQKVGDEGIDAAYAYLATLNPESGVTEEEGLVVFGRAQHASVRTQTCYTLKRVLGTSERYVTD